MNPAGGGWLRISLKGIPFKRRCLEEERYPTRRMGLWRPVPQGLSLRLSAKEPCVKEIANWRTPAEDFAKARKLGNLKKKTKCSSGKTFILL